MKLAWKCGAVLAMVTVTALSAQAKPSSTEVLAQVEKNYKTIRDYRVDVEVSVESTQVHMPTTKATVYYKRPDKVRVVANEGFAMLPKDAFPGNPVDQIKANFDTAYAGSAKLGGAPVHVLKLVPKTSQAQGTMRLYVEKRRSIIMGMDTETQGAKFGSRWSYVRVDGKYWLPSRIKVEMSGSMVPQAFDPDEGKVKPARSGKGTALITFKNYRVNKGVPDSVFVEKKQR